MPLLSPWDFGKNSIQENKAKGEDFDIPKTIRQIIIQKNKVKGEDLIPQSLKKKGLLYGRNN